MPSSPRKPEPVLDERLSAAAAYVRPGARMADIGCDHGFLTAYLLENHVEYVDAQEEGDGKKNYNDMANAVIRRSSTRLPESMAPSGLPPVRSF